jgi:RNA polymerase sigma-70 factor (ECF subfamily)
MLGCVHDAEDALQETLLNAWLGLPRFAGRSSLRSWLYVIATNASLKTIERRARQALPIDCAFVVDSCEQLAYPLVESVRVAHHLGMPIELEGQLASADASYEQRESVELAFVAALQHISARQMAVLILRDVFGFSAREAAETLEMTPTAVDTALQRARRAVDRRLPARSQQLTLQALEDEGLRATVERFVQAWDRADVESVVTMLTVSIKSSQARSHPNPGPGIGPIGGC